MRATTSTRSAPSHPSRSRTSSATTTTIPTASTSTRRSASSPTSRAGSSPARTPTSRTHHRAGASSISQATRWERSRPPRSASSRPPTSPRPATPRTTAAASCATDGCSPPTSGTRRRATADGQLIVWFPPFDSRQVRYCKLDVGIATAGQIYVDDQDRIYVASARPGNPSTGVLRYTGPFPTSGDAAGGCGKKDATGAPMADSVSREPFVAAVPPSSLRTPWCRPVTVGSTCRASSTASSPRSTATASSSAPC